MVEMARNNENKTVGFSRRIRYEWLEHAADLAAYSCRALYDDQPLDNCTLMVLRHEIGRYVAKHMGGSSSPLSVSGQKATGLLSRIWLSVPEKLVSLRNAALKHYEQVEPKERLLLHWGMTSAVYPFVLETAEVVGRLLSLQRTFRLRQVRERMHDMAGERPTVYYAVTKIIRSFVDWGVLASPLDGTGTYSKSEPLDVVNEALLAWLVEALLHAKGSSRPLFSLINSPGTFPFHIRPENTTDYVVRQNPRLTVFRQGVSEVMVGLTDPA